MLRCKYVKNSSGERKIMQIEFKEKREQMVMMSCMLFAIWLMVRQRQDKDRVNVKDKDKVNLSSFPG